MIRIYCTDGGSVDLQGDNVVSLQGRLGESHRGR